MSEARTSKRPQTRVFKGFEGLARLKDQQPSTDQSLSQGQKDSREPAQAYVPEALC